MALNMEKLAERLGQLKTKNESKGSGISFIDINDGRNVVRIMPPMGDDILGKEVWVHYGVGKSETNKKGTMVVCPTTGGDNNACPVCELAAEFRKLSKKKDDSYSKQARDIMRKKRVYYNAIAREEALSLYEKDAEGKWFNSDTGDIGSPVKILATGIMIYEALLGIICDPEYGDITDPTMGLDVIITKSGSGPVNTDYDVKTVRKESPIGFDEWEACLNDLGKLAEYKSYDELCDLLEGKESAPATEEAKPKVKESEKIVAEQEEALEATTGEASTEPASEDELQSEIMNALARRRNKK